MPVLLLRQPAQCLYITILSVSVQPVFSLFSARFQRGQRMGSFGISLSGPLSLPRSLACATCSGGQFTRMR